MPRPSYKFVECEGCARHRTIFCKRCEEGEHFKEKEVDLVDLLERGERAYDRD